MRKSCLLAIAVVLTLGMISCAKPVYRQTVDQWMSTAPAKAKYNVAGQWRGPEGHHYNYWTGYNRSSFGSMMLVQKGTRITGTYAEYDVVGVVNGAQVTLFGLHGDVVYYTWHFTYDSKSKILMGKMCDGYYPTVEAHCYPLSLEKN
jgi:hypothetical protein